MQVLNVASFAKRVIYNLTKTYANQLKYGQGYSHLKPAIALTITDFPMFDQTQRFLTRFSLKEKQELFDYTDPEIELVFVELPKFTKNLDELENLTDKWIYFIKEAPSLEMIPPTFQQVPELDKAMNIANQANLSVEEVEKLQKREVFLEDQRGFIVKAKQEGKSELILRLLERQLGKIPLELISQIQKLKSAKLEGLGDILLDLKNLDELSAWLQE